jgi:NAD(P)-dependent dehydrogenase (short-subunit alcohol dehydrogenase family)
MTANIHASCVAIAGKGVLILGASGAGKSDLALRLIDEGAKLVADDRCEIFVRAGKLCARAPASIAGLLELRGIGIIALPHAPATRVVMAVRLHEGHAARLPKPAFFEPPAPLGPRGKVPLIVVNAAAPSAPARIRAALAAFSTGTFRDTFNPE